MIRIMLKETKDLIEAKLDLYGYFYQLFYSSDISHLTREELTKIGILRRLREDREEALSKKEQIVKQRGRELTAGLILLCVLLFIILFY